MIKLGVAFCGSFCTTQTVINELEILVTKGFDITPILSEHVDTISTRFGEHDKIRERIESICGKECITDIPTAERIGPDKMFDVLLLAPCTGNTLAKLAHGFSDNTVTLATKSHLRNERPVIVALATNDGLSGNLQNIATILNRKHFYFVPFGQDDAIKKTNSLVCHFEMIEDTIKEAMFGKQIQPLLK